MDEQLKEHIEAGGMYRVDKDGKPIKDDIQFTVAPLNPFQELLNDFLKDPEFKKYWDALAPKRNIVMVLLAHRHRADLTQTELAEQTGWTVDFVRQIEGFSKDTFNNIYIPTQEVIQKYIDTCRAVYK